MHDVPKDLMDQIKSLEEQFTVSNEKLLEVTDRFESELKKGKSHHPHRVQDYSS